MEKLVRNIVCTIGGLLYLLAAFMILILLVGFLNPIAVFRISGILQNLVMMGGFILAGTLIIFTQIKNKEIKNTMIRYSLIVIFLAYCLALYITMFSSSSGIRPQNEVHIRNNISFEDVNIIPFATILDYISKGFSGEINLDIVISNLAGNFIMFMPFVFLLLCLKKTHSITKKEAIGLLVLLALIELLQFIFGVGSFDLDDIILNSFGGWIAYLLFNAPWIQSVLRKMYILD